MDAISSFVLQDGWRKGPWTALEDRLLTEYVHQHGGGSWNSVANLTGLRRSGKSCRLRWVNYLRPDLKKGKITPDEETLILQLHALLGNRWSAIARCLPGRTDNEIKNFWRTHFKKSRPPRRPRAQLLHQYHNHQQLQLQQLQHLQLQQQQQQQEQGSLQEPQVMMAQAMHQNKEYCCSMEPTLPDHYMLQGDVPCDDALWESLWKLVDGNDSGEGTSGGDFALASY